MTYGYGDLHLTRSLIITLITQDRLETKQGLCLPGWTPVVVVVIVVVVGFVVVVGVGTISPV